MQNPLLEHIDRTYNIAVDYLTEAQSAALAQVYQSLPGFAGYPPPSQCPVWFGPVPDDENTPSVPYLWASAERSGLQVSGWLEAEVWRRWEAQFLAAASASLGFAVRDADE